MKGAYAEAQDISSKTFLRKVLIDLDLNPDEAFVHLDSKDWESGLKKIDWRCIGQIVGELLLLNYFTKEKIFYLHGDKIVFGLFERVKEVVDYHYKIRRIY